MTTTVEARTEITVALIKLSKETMVPVIIAGAWIFGWPVVIAAGWIGFLMM